MKEKNIREKQINLTDYIKTTADWGESLNQKHNIL